MIIFLAVLYWVFSILVIGWNLLWLDFLNNFEKVSGVFINIWIVIYLLLFTSLITTWEQNKKTKIELDKLNVILKKLNKKSKIFANLSLKNTKLDSKSLLNTSFKNKIREKFPTFDLLIWIDPEHEDSWRLWIYTTRYNELNENIKNIFTKNESYPKSCYPCIDNYAWIGWIEEQLNKIASVLLECMKNNIENETSN